MACIAGRRVANGLLSAGIAGALGLLLLAWSGFAFAADRSWSQGGDSLPADPAVRLGSLPNGLRYAILKHNAPPHEVSLRLRIAAGALQETADQDGVAHLLEHMAFRGSSHVRDGEVWKTLARLGVTFGADSNAYTTPSETYFQFDLPSGGGAGTGAGLTLLREIAGELTLSPAALDDERNVVLAEARLTDSPSVQADQARTAAWFEGQPVAQRGPMGDPQVISHIGVDQLRHYYDAYYRPERATVIVVGDIDPDAVEAQIKARFADWAGKGPAGADPVAAPSRDGGLQVRAFVQPGAPSSVSLAWMTPYRAGPRSQAAERERLLARLAIGVLNHRLAEGGGPVDGYLIAEAAHERPAPLADITVLTIDCAPGQWRSALAATEKIRRQALVYGVRQDEVDREAAEALHQWQRAAADTDTRSASAIAGAMLAAVDQGGVITSPVQDLAQATDAFEMVTAGQVDEALRALFRGAGPKVFLSSPQPIGNEAAVAAAVAHIERAPVPAYAETPAALSQGWPYDDFGKAGVVAERREIADLGVSFVRFENGVRLTVKPAAFSAGQVQVQVSVGGGRLDLPRDRVSAYWAADGGVIDANGPRGIDRSGMRLALADKVYSMSFLTADEGFVFSGVTRPADLDTQMQVLAAYVSDPAWRPQVFAHIKTLFTNLLPQVEASPSGALGDYVGGLLHDGDPRWATPTLADIRAARPEDLRALLEQPLATGAIEVTVVGDIGVERAIRAVAATFGALPPRRRPAPPPPEAYRTHFPAHTAAPVVRYHSGHADQALALIAWPTGDVYAASPRPAAVRVLQRVLQNRLIEQLRTAQGVTYTPLTGLEASSAFPDFGYLYAAASTPPAQTTLVLDNIQAIAADLRSADISDDELERAREPAIATLERAQQAEKYWLSGLVHAQTDPRRLDLIRGALPDLQAVSAADVRRAAMAYLGESHAWKLVIAPYGGALSAASAPATSAGSPAGSPASSR
jgi:zinc protease